MPVRFHSDFIVDLVSIGDANLAGRVLRKVFDNGGRFIDQAKEDHRYKGITDAWIRKVSKGMRVIYVKEGDDIVLYRAGQHSVEDDLVAPNDGAEYRVLEDSIQGAMSSGLGTDFRRPFKGKGVLGRSEDTRVGVTASGMSLLYNHMDRFLYGNLLGRRFLPHRDVYLLSPYLTPDLLRPTNVFGQMLDELIEGGATIWLVTHPPARSSEIATFEELAARNINVFFNSALHAKVFAFVLNRDQLKPDQTLSRDFVSIGSANLTAAGINPTGLLNDNIQYELSYEPTAEDWPDVQAFILHVTGLSIELDVVRANLINRASASK